jgi:hypothetical protein
MSTAPSDYRIIRERPIAPDLVPRTLEEFFQVFFVCARKDREKRQRRREQTTCLYLVQSSGTRDIKIGVTQTLSKRLKDLRRSHGRPLTILDVYRFSPSDLATRVEKALHEYWADGRQKGEWFAFPEKMSVQRFLALSRKCVEHILETVHPRSQGALPFVETLAAEGFGRKRPPEVP